MKSTFFGVNTFLGCRSAIFSLHTTKDAESLRFFSISHKSRCLEVLLFYQHLCDPFTFCLPECDQYYFLHAGKCVDDCPDGFFASEQQEECVHCHADCASCDGPGFDDCTACRHWKAVRYNGRCLLECPSDTFYDRSTNECRGRDDGKQKN